jgi:hypothetical protein
MTPAGTSETQSSTGVATFIYEMIIFIYDIVIFSYDMATFICEIYIW